MIHQGTCEFEDYEYDDDSGYYTLKNFHFDQFVVWFKRWLNHFNLGGWEIRYYFHESTGEKSPKASMLMDDYCNRLAVISLFDEWDIEPDTFGLSKVAFHECLELLFADVHILAQSRNFDCETYDAAHHHVIRTFEGSMFDELWKAGHDIFDIQPPIKAE
jgi:hypothetical protein